jgi:hypothetical protein
LSNVRSARAGKATAMEIGLNREENTQQAMLLKHFLATPRKNVCACVNITEICIANVMSSFWQVLTVPRVESSLLKEMSLNW